MFRLRHATICLRRLIHGRTVGRDQIKEQLQVCLTEDEVYDLVGKHKAKLNVDHVSFAVGQLWKLQGDKPDYLRTSALTISHPQFLTLRVLAENKICLMDDSMLVTMLYTFLRLGVEHHDSLMQQMVSEAWLRVDGFQMDTLSKFSNCLTDMQLVQSPLMGQIANIVAQKLSTIDDARILSVLMVSLSWLASARLRHALMSRAELLLDTTTISGINSPRRILQFLRRIRLSHWPLLEKCNQILLSNVSRMTADNIRIILNLYRALQYRNCDFRLAAKQRLMELMDSCTDNHSFTEMFTALAPMANADIQERLENTALLLADEFNAVQAMDVTETLEEINCRNHRLIQKVASAVQRNLHVYKPLEMVKITHAFDSLNYHVLELLTELRYILVKRLHASFMPSKVTLLTEALTLLPSPRLEEGTAARLEAIVPQCRLRHLSVIAVAVAKWVRNDPFHTRSTPSKYLRLLQALNRCSHGRLQTAERLDLLLDELRYMAGEWFVEMLLDEVVVTLQRMMDQISWDKVSVLSLFLLRFNYLCPPLMERIVNVVKQDIKKMHPLAVLPILTLFSKLNYESPAVDELYDVCVQHLSPHLSSFDSPLLVLLAHTLAMADCFPEKLIRIIFSIDFLGRLDAQLETLHVNHKTRVRQKLMELNRAVCLQCPEFQVPWFHDRYCLQRKKKGGGSIAPAQQLIHNMLADVVGGRGYVQVAVTTPYFYTVGFEFILDKYQQPLAYNKLDTFQMEDRGESQWSRSLQEKVREELPHGAQRVAVEFLGSRNFCKNSRQLIGDSVMRKRHLEILGYRVVQISNFELNSMELSSQSAWKEYLRKKIL